MEEDDFESEYDDDTRDSPSKFVYPEPPSPPRDLEPLVMSEAVEVFPVDPALQASGFDDEEDDDDDDDDDDDEEEEEEEEDDDEEEEENEEEEVIERYAKRGKVAPPPPPPPKRIGE